MDNEEALKCLGLSTIQARVYLTLVHHGRASANTLSKHSDVARSEIYRIMTQFQNLGIVQKIISTPIMFEATPIEQALLALVGNKAKELKKVKKQTKNLIQILGQKKLAQNNVLENEPSLFMIPPTKTALNKRIELIENSQSLIKGLIPWKGYKFALDDYTFREALKKAISRGVKFQLLIHNPQEVTFPPDHYKLMKIFEDNSCSIITKKLDNPVTVSIFDEKDVLIFSYKKTGPHGSPLLWSNDISIIKMANCYFDNQWKKAEQT